MADRVKLDERLDLERLHNALKDTPEPEDIRLGTDPAKEEELDHKLEKIEAAITDEERDRQLAEQKRQIEQLQEQLSKLVASGRATPMEAAEQLNEHELMQQQRRLYDRIRKHGNKVRIVIHSHPTPALNKPVVVAWASQAGGSRRVLERNKTVVVTAEELEVLDNGVCVTEEHLVEPGTENVMHVRNRIPTVPYTLVDHQFMENAL